MNVSAAETGIIHIDSSRPVAEVVAALLSLLEAKGVSVFAVIDHSGEAAKAGLEMPETKVVIFGSPKAGTPLMLAVPDIALDLPLKILVAESPTGTTIAYNSPAYLQGRFGLQPDLVAKIAVIEQLAMAVR
jgi:uncharacterized protein (DUF302 family)